MEYNKLNILLLSLNRKKINALDFLGFLRLDYQAVFGKMNPHSGINLLKQVFKQWNTHLDYGINKLKESQKNLFRSLKNKTAKSVLHFMYLHVQK